MVVCDIGMGKRESVSIARDVRRACLYKARADLRFLRHIWFSGCILQSDSREQEAPSLRLDIVLKDVVYVCDNAEEVSLNSGKDAAGKAGLEHFGVVLALTGGAFDEPVVDELLLCLYVEVEKCEEQGLGSFFELCGGCDGRDERDLLALEEAP